MPQLPRVQVGVPCSVLHACPHPPQSDVVTLRSVSQPLLRRPSQLPQFDAQLIEQIPRAHEGVPFVELHALPQTPQWLVLLSVDVSQPFLTSPSQLPKPASQVMPQLPEEHVAVPLVESHTLPQMPQLPVLVLMLVSQPFVTSPSQSSQPGSHSMVQVPLAQPGVPRFELHRLPHTPQSETVFLRSVSQPLATFLSQSSQPPAQVIEHVPALHVGVPLVVLHGCPQPPQCSALVSRFASHPLATLPSQLP